MAEEPQSPQSRAVKSCASEPDAIGRDRQIVESASAVLKSERGADGPPASTCARTVLGDLDLLHLLALSGPRGPELMAAALRLLEGGGELRGFSLKPVGAQWEATLRLDGISPQAARAACGRLAEQPGVTQARVEHLYLAGRRGGG